MDKLEELKEWMLASQTTSIGDIFDKINELLENEEMEKPDIYTAKLNKDIEAEFDRNLMTDLEPIAEEIEKMAMKSIQRALNEEEKDQISKDS